MAMTLRLPEQLDIRLTSLSEKTGRNKSQYVITALTNYLDDMEDILIANAVLERIARGEEKTYSADEVDYELEKERNKQRARKL